MVFMIETECERIRQREEAQMFRSGLKSELLSDDLQPIWRTRGDCLGAEDSLERLSTDLKQFSRSAVNDEWIKGIARHICSFSLPFGLLFGLPFDLPFGLLVHRPQRDRRSCYNVGAQWQLPLWNNKSNRIDSQWPEWLISQVVYNCIS